VAIRVEVQIEVITAFSIKRILCIY